MGEGASSVSLLHVGRYHRTAAALLHRSWRLAPESVQFKSQFRAVAGTGWSHLVDVELASRVLLVNATQIVTGGTKLFRWPKVLQHSEEVLAGRDGLRHYVDASYARSVKVETRSRHSHPTRIQKYSTSI
jgi:hypothetical protein